MSKLDQIDGLIVAIEDTMIDLDNALDYYGLKPKEPHTIPLWLYKDLRNLCLMKEQLKAQKIKKLPRMWQNHFNSIKKLEKGFENENK